MENLSIWLRGLNSFYVRVMDGTASLCPLRAHAEILPVLNQQLLIHISAKQKPYTLMPGWNLMPRAL